MMTYFDFFYHEGEMCRIRGHDVMASEIAYAIIEDEYKERLDSFSNLAFWLGYHSLNLSDDECLSILR